MAITVYGRKAIRRFERETGERIVHAAGPYLTTIDHRHLAWTGEYWTELEATFGGCGLPTRLASCWTLFGYGSYYTGFMRGPCRDCEADCGQLHYWDCPTLDHIMDLPSVNPDYWPRPVHRPRWLDSEGGGRVNTRTRLMHLLALGLDVPVELLGGGVNHWASWYTINPRGTCSFCRTESTTHVVEWPPGRIDGTHGLPVRTFTCEAHAGQIRAYQESCGDHVTVRAVVPG